MRDDWRPGDYVSHALDNVPRQAPVLGHIAYRVPMPSGVMNPHEPGCDRTFIRGDEDLCTYCCAPVNDNPRNYKGEKHELDCPIAAHVAKVEAKASGQNSLFQVLEDAQ